MKQLMGSIVEHRVMSLH